MKMPSLRTVIKQVLRGFFVVIVLAVISVFVLGLLVVLGFHKTAPPAGTDPLVVHQLTINEAGQINAALKSNEHPYSCVNNTDNICINGPGISYYPIGFDITLALDSYKPTDSQTIKQIMGTIVNATDTKITIKSDTGKAFQIMFPTNTLQSFYAGKGSDYNISTITGRNLLVTYHEQPKNHSPSIDQSQIIGSLLINPVSE